jgi:regulator of replication initiation timing
MHTQQLQQQQGEMVAGFESQRKELHSYIEQQQPSFQLENEQLRAALQTPTATIPPAART